jgi:hypothetical protein
MNFYAKNQHDNQNPFFIAFMKKTVAQWASQLERRATPSHSSNYQYQIKYAGPQEILVQGGGEEIWADGIRVADGFLLECKFIVHPDRSPFIENSQIPNFIRQKIVNRIADEFFRYAAVINDPNTPIKALEVIINEPSAIPFFQKLLQRYKIPGRVFYQEA